MAVFSNINGKLTLLNTVSVAKEKDLQRLMEENLQETLDLHFIATEYRTSSGRIDTLAIDGDGSPVIIEYKRKKDDNVINQALSYLKWLKAQRPEFFQMLMLNKLGKDVADGIRIDWKNPRIICVAESFSQYDIDTVEMVQLRIELFKYRQHENNLFTLDMVTVNDQQKNRIEVFQAVPVESNLAIIHAMKEQAGASHTTRSMFDELRERILGLEEYIVEKPGKRMIAYRLTKNFAEVLIKKDRLIIDLRQVDYDDPRRLIESIHEGYSIPLSSRITLSDLADLDYVGGIIEQSYSSIL